MSPEAILAERPAPAFDLWALAVVMYEAIAGQRPFQGRDSDEVFRRVSEGAFPDPRDASRRLPIPGCSLFS